VLTREKILVPKNLLKVVFIDTVGTVIRVAAIIRVAAPFGALTIISSVLFFWHDNLQVVKHQNKKKFEKCFFVPFF
jgi:hypothetical protein